jgi:magnesium chelatase family protein
VLKERVKIMLAKVLSAALAGVEAVPVDVECDVSDGVPSFDTIGLPELSVREARVRVRSAIRHSDLPFPKSHVTLNLAPADLRKDGTAFDLPVALAVLLADGNLPPGCLDGWLVVGELSLTGCIRAVPGILAVAELARTMGLKGIICPIGNVIEAQAIDGIEVRAATALGDVVRLLRANEPWPVSPDVLVSSLSPRMSLDWSDVRGHALAKRALEVAATGGHNALLVGVPGTGKGVPRGARPSRVPADQGTSHNNKSPGRERFTASETITMLRDDGWREVRQTGSHRIFRHAARPGTVAVPDHGSRTLATGTACSILRSAGLR